MREWPLYANIRHCRSIGSLRVGLPASSHNRRHRHAVAERVTWNEVIAGYEALFAPLTAQTVGPLLASMPRRSSGSIGVLDVCTGHGVLAAAPAGDRMHKAVHQIL